MLRIFYLQEVSTFTGSVQLNGAGQKFSEASPALWSETILIYFLSLIHRQRKRERDRERGEEGESETRRHSQFPFWISIEDARWYSRGRSSFLPSASAAIRVPRVPVSVATTRTRSRLAITKQ